MRSYSIGLDVHRRNWFVTVIQKGAVVFHGSIPPTVQAFESVLRRLHLDPSGPRADT